MARAFDIYVIVTKYVTTHTGMRTRAQTEVGRLQQQQNDGSVTNVKGHVSHSSTSRWKAKLGKFWKKTNGPHQAVTRNRKYNRERTIDPT